MALSVPRDKVLPHVHIKCHDFNLVITTYIYSFQSSSHSICFNFVRIFFYKIEKYCLFLEIKFIIYINVILNLLLKMTYKIIIHIYIKI